MEANKSTTTPRALISAMQVTLDGYVLGPEGDAESFESWADGLELLPTVDAFVLGGGMFSGYEHFWAAIRDEPKAAADVLGRDPYPLRGLAERQALELVSAEPMGAGRINLLPPRNRRHRGLRP